MKELSEGRSSPFDGRSKKVPESFKPETGHVNEAASAPTARDLTEQESGNRPGILQDKGQTQK